MRRLTLAVSALAIIASHSLSASATRGEYTEASFERGINVAHYTAIVLDNHPFGDPLRFAEKDAQWIAEQGFDHIRLSVDGTRIVDQDGRLLPERLAPVNAAISWCRSYGLGIILDMHKFEGADCADQENGADIYGNEELTQKAVQLWKDLTLAYSDVGPRLRFELLNEPIAPTPRESNILHAKLIAAIREIDSDRILIVNTNRWADLDHLDALELPADDPNIIASIHYYRPFAFTHQGASWTELGVYGISGIPFPGRMPDLKGKVPSGHWLEEIAGQEMGAEQIKTDFAQVAKWAKANQRQVYVGELGAYSAADAESRKAWYTAVLDALEQEGLPWAIWEYNHSFGIRDFNTGRQTLVLESAKPFLD